LPSQFAGGMLKLEHAKQTNLIDTASKSAFSTQVVAFYTDVTHSVEPISSGYRLALSYNLIHIASPSLKPDLEDFRENLSGARRLRRVLQTWINSRIPPLIVYLFDHEYSASNLLAAALKGSDAHIVRNVRAVAEPLGFRIHVANIELFRTGMGNNDDDYGDEWEAEDGRSEWSASCLVNLQGNPVNIQNLKIKKEHVIPYDLAQELPDEVKKDDYFGNVGTTVVVSRIPLIFF
jgi:hypothetical protein